MKTASSFVDASGTGKQNHLRRLLIPLFVAAIGALLHCTVLGAAPADKLDFNFQIRPVLADRCFKCHGPDDKARKGKLRLDSADAAYALRDAATSKRAIVPHHPEQSELYRRITAKDPDDRMPPAASNLTLSDEERELLRRWIAQGAQYIAHWAFIPVGKVAVPKTAPGAHVLNPIDTFIQSRLEREGLKPTTPAPRETLIRRLSFDLCGLPPTLQEIDAFIADTSPKAYEKVVDR